MLIVSLHVLSMEDALVKLEQLYDSAWQSTRLGFAGVAFIFLGLVFAKVLIKLTRPSDDVMLFGKWGYINLSLKAIENLSRKTFRKFEFLRVVNVKTSSTGNQVKVDVNITVSITENIAALLQVAQKELGEKLERMLGEQIEVSLSINIINISEQLKKNEVVLNH
jgi:uncharacterized alkaline shock family protein YloU